MLQVVRQIRCRSGVCNAIAETMLNFVMRRKLIDTALNRNLVRNRKGIERMARGSYGVPEKEYRRLIG